MFNFSANNLLWKQSIKNPKYNIYIFIDQHTKRCYKLYDFNESRDFSHDKIYCVSGKINSADRLYLVLENVKEDKKNYSHF